MAALLCPAKFGSLPSGEAVELWTLKGHGGLVVEAITYGGIVTRILAPRRGGVQDDVVLGFNNLDSYLTRHPYFGAITGRVAGRIANAAFALDGCTYQLARNDPPNHLHGGVTGFDKRLWEAAPVDRADGAPSVRLTYASPDGEERYPGNLSVAVTYTVSDDNVFLIETEATSDKTTPLSLTHHSYFNLAGEASGSIANHVLTIFSGTVVPTDDKMTPCGRLEPVTAANDFRAPRRLGDAIPSLHLRHGNLYALPGRGDGGMVVAARLEDPASGRVLTVSTTEKYVQLYSGAYLDCQLPGKSGKVYPPFAGVCLECEGYPDASNEEMRKDILLHPGLIQRRTTAYAFSVDAAGRANTIS